MTLCVLAVPAIATQQNGTSQNPGGDLFDEIHRRGAPIARDLQTVSASFVETTSSTLLKTPQVARGTLVAQRPDKVRLQYTGADARTVLISKDTLTIEWPKRSLHDQKDISSTMRRAQRFFTATSPAELRKHFDIAAAVAADRPHTWEVVFTPRRKQLREGVAGVRLWIDQQTLLLRAMRLDFPGGDTTLMEFADVRLNPPVAADTFTRAAR